MNSPNFRKPEPGRRRRPADLLRPASDLSFADDDSSDGSAAAGAAGAAGALWPQHAVESVVAAESESLDDVDVETSSLARALQQPVVIVTPPADADADGNAEGRPPTPPRFRRRNSVSLPAGLNAMEPPEYELRLTPERTQAEGYDTSDTFSDIMTDDDEDGKVIPVAGNRPIPMPTKSTLEQPISHQNTVESGGWPHRNSVRAPSPLVTPTKNGKRTPNHEEDGDDLLLELGLHGEPSPGNSITSMNSISSLLKEKLAMTLPAMLKKYRKPKEYKLRGFVMMLFLSIVFLVGFAHVFYNHQVLQRAYFDLIRLNKHERVVRILSAEGTELLKGELGTLIGRGEKPYACLPRDERQDGSVCLEWMQQARLHLQYERQDKVHCYRMTWTSLDERVHPTDCYELTAGGNHWYGGGRPTVMKWPMGSGRVGFAPFLTGDSVSERHHWGNVLRRYFISSKGVAITVDPETPLYMSVNDRLCLQARHDDFAYVREPRVPAVLNYSLCTMNTMNMTELHRQLSEKSLWDGLKDTDVEVIYKLLTEPVWQITPQVADDLSELAILNYTEDFILNYTEDVTSLGFFRQGHILLNEFWQPNVGDLAMDKERFPTMNNTIDIVHRRGFKVALTIQPFIATESTNFADAVRQQLLVGSRGAADYVPALTRYKSVLSAAALDVTNPESITWLQDKLRELVRRYNVDGFFLDLGVAYDLPHYYKFERRLTNPDHYKARFTEAVQSVVTVVGVSSAIKRPRPPAFVTLPAVPATWEGLQSIIPTILTYGMIGYPFVMPGAIGGDYVNATLTEPVGGQRLETNRTSSSTTTTPASPSATDDPAVQAALSAQSSVGEEQLQQTEVLDDAELYLRWQQLATFLPVIRYTHLPNKYGNAQVLENARMLSALRQKTVNPVLRKYTREALDLGLPLVRPLWMLDSQDPACRVVADEFSIGDDIIVAPVLKPGSVEREVYLPTGVWKDGIDGSLRKGNRWIHLYKVPLDKIAYFVKMPDNTRF